MKTAKFSVSALFAATAAAIALSAASYAATPGAGDAATPAAQESATPRADRSEYRGEHRFHRDGRHHGPRHMKHRHDDAGLWVPGYGPVSQRFVDTLSLTEQQSKLLEEARAAQKQLRGERGDGMRAMFKEKREQVQQGKIDPREALKQADARHEQMRAERRQIDEKWLAVWESLDKTQQDKVVARMNERAEKLARRFEERQDRKARSEGKPAEKASS
ncbi:hypothetical protein [Parapusillimonas granuli]|uniref:LTXXQ motif family protein n=1 Tax=Parapusillimonas granuli TaxID=380911 RepID=A0A853FWS8_9BURK|nr:hypothetical protein [Parapusillimonas granuli]MBB5214064.1 putative Fe-S protein YdhL (DUF1289 family) [Parapusillimonas granuli]MEB2400913.1 hypothetical protein [Alcaligenaceae bacterium]NYT50485.1 hypothetical protein [Parapusillimonas granuli]